MKWTAQRAQAEREAEGGEGRKAGRQAGGCGELGGWGREKGQKHLAVHYLGHWLTDWLPADVATDEGARAKDIGRIAAWSDIFVIILIRA